MNDLSWWKYIVYPVIFPFVFTFIVAKNVCIDLAEITESLIKND